MLLSTKMDVTPVVQIEGIKINDGMPGEITLQIQKAYLDIINS
jgi:branched-subunit amino acid aminotransferase/4-amino-4-deoxychorismate lyase